MSPQKIAYSVGETAHLLSIGRTKLYELVKVGILPATKIGKRTVFCAKDIERFIDSLHNMRGTR